MSTILLNQMFAMVYITSVFITIYLEMISNFWAKTTRWIVTNERKNSNHRLTAKNMILENTMLCRASVIE